MTPSESQEIRAMAGQVIDFIHRTAMHHAMWYMEIRHQLGHEAASSILEKAWKNSRDAQISRLAKIFGFTYENGNPSALTELGSGRLEELRQALAMNWLAVDGLWFQAVEEKFGMYDAKRCNDACWAQFSPFEAESVKNTLQLGNHSGLQGLKLALGQRLYAFINKQQIEAETENSFVFRMLDCRVQSARKRKNLADYPCKSAGIVEYREFAKTIDSRIRTECISCPPDPHDDTYYCAWKFVID